MLPAPHINPLTHLLHHTNVTEVTNNNQHWTGLDNSQVFYKAILFSRAIHFKHPYSLVSRSRVPFTQSDLPWSCAVRMSMV